MMIEKITGISKSEEINVLIKKVNEIIELVSKTSHNTDSKATPKDCSNCIHSKVCAYNNDTNQGGLCDDYIRNPS